MEFGSWSVLMVTFLLVVYIAQGGIVLSAVVHLSHVSGARWRADIAPHAHKTGFLFPLALALLIILLAAPENTFPYYADADIHLNAWHNYTFLVTREVIMLLLVTWVSFVFVWANERHDRNPSPKTQKTLTLTAALVLLMYVLYGTLLAWDFEMTLTPGWHSPMYSAYFFVSNFHMYLGIFVVSAYVLRSLSGTPVLTDNTFNYLAQMLLGFTLLWVYTFFAQFLTMWYGNLPEEVGRLYTMMYEDADQRKGAAPLASLFWWFVVLKSFIPFSLLIFAFVRHTPAMTAFVGLLIFTGTALERYTWIASSYSTHFPLTAQFDLLVILVVSVLVLLSWRAGIWAEPRLYQQFLGKEDAE